MENGYELEYCSTEETTGTDWVRTSFNKMLDFVTDNQGEEFRNGISNYVNVDRAIDSMIYTMFIGGADNTLKNILWATFDGDVWIPSMYDMDSTWGLFWKGTYFIDADEVLMPDYILNGNNTLWKRLLENYKQEIINRYFELREEALSIENIATQFKNFEKRIPDIALEMETHKWSDVTLNKENHYEQIVAFAVDRALIFDNWFDSLRTA